MKKKKSLFHFRINRTPFATTCVARALAHHMPGIKAVVAPSILDQRVFLINYVGNDEVALSWVLYRVAQAERGLVVGRESVPSGHHGLRAGLGRAGGAVLPDRHCRPRQPNHCVYGGKSRKRDAIKEMQHLDKTLRGVVNGHLPLMYLKWSM